MPRPKLPKPTPRSAATDLTLLPEIVEVIAAPEPAVEAATAPAPVVVETHRTKPEPAEAAADAQDETALAPEDEFSDDLPPVTDEDLMVLFLTGGVALGVGLALGMMMRSGRSG